MSNIKSPNLQRAAAFRADFEEAMKALATKYNTTIDLGRITVEPDGSMSSKLTAIPLATLKTDESAMDQMKNVNPEWIKEGHRFIGKYMGQVFTHKGEQHQVVGYAKRSASYPIVTTNNKGQCIRFPTLILDKCRPVAQVTSVQY